MVIILFTIKQKKTEKRKREENISYNHSTNWKTKTQYFDNDLWMSHKEYERKTIITT